MIFWIAFGTLEQTLLPQLWYVIEKEVKAWIKHGTISWMPSWTFDGDVKKLPTIVQSGSTRGKFHWMKSIIQSQTLIYLIKINLDGYRHSSHHSAHRIKTQRTNSDWYSLPCINPIRSKLSRGNRRHLSRWNTGNRRGIVIYCGTLRAGWLWVSDIEEGDTKGNRGERGGGGGGSESLCLEVRGWRAHLASNQSVATSTCVHGTLEVAAQSTRVHPSPTSFVTPHSGNFISHNRALKPPFHSSFTPTADPSCRLASPHPYRSFSISFDRAPSFRPSDQQLSVLRLSTRSLLSSMRLRAFIPLSFRRSFRLRRPSSGLGSDRLRATLTRINDGT